MVDEKTESRRDLGTTARQKPAMAIGILSQRIVWLQSTTVGFIGNQLIVRHSLKSPTEDSLEREGRNGSDMPCPSPTLPPTLLTPARACKTGQRIQDRAMPESDVNRRFRYRQLATPPCLSLLPPQIVLPHLVGRPDPDPILILWPATILVLARFWPARTFSAMWTIWSGVYCL
jgi:hypothetical protein